MIRIYAYNFFLLFYILLCNVPIYELIILRTLGIIIYDKKLMCFVRKFSTIEVNSLKSIMPHVGRPKLNRYTYTP